MFPDDYFDVSYSNSAIEHVGSLKDQIVFADEIRCVAPRYYAQTTNRWLFVEPNLIIAFIHPISLFDGEAKTGALFQSMSVDRAASQAQIDKILGRIGSSTEGHSLFIYAKIIEERFWG